MKYKLISMVLLGLLVVFQAVSADGTADLKTVKPKPKEVKTGFINEKDYMLFVPHSYTGDKDTKSYPLILYLHGYKCDKAPAGPPENAPGLGPHIRHEEKTFPFFVIFPRGAHHGDWFGGKNAQDWERALAILDDVQKTYKVVDGKRLYLTGVSMGGDGTWKLASVKPDLWAAIAPMSAGKWYWTGNTPEEFADNIAPKVKNIPCWCFHEKHDGIANSDFTNAIAKKLNARFLKSVEAPSGKGTVFCTIFDDLGGKPDGGIAHMQCWSNAFSDPTSVPRATPSADEKHNLYDWLLKHRRK